MARTTTSAVQAALSINYDSDRAPDLTRSVAWAYSLTNSLVTCAATKGITLDSTTLELLECDLACHKYQTMDPGYASRNTNKKGGTFQGQWTMGLERTSYGQDALNLDVSGCLVNFNKRQIGSINWGGKAASAALSWDDRN